MRKKEAIEELYAISKYRSIRVAHFLRRFVRQGFHRDPGERHAFRRWLLAQLLHREDPTKEDHRFNPVFNVIRILEQQENHIQTNRGAEPEDQNLAIMEGWEEPDVIQQTVSVILPVYNGGPELKDLLDVLDGQSGVTITEVIIVDSGSTDGSIEVAKAHGAKLILITQDEFTHSYARNLGAEYATGDFLLFMTQDACPTGPLWLRRLFRPLLAQVAVAVSCRETPRPGCDLFGRVSVWSYARYLGVLEKDRIGKMPKEPDRDAWIRNGQLSDNACLIGKSVFDRYRYRYGFAEDLDLGLRLIQDGYQIAMLSGVQVIHSHTRTSFYHFRRTIVAAKTMRHILPDGEYHDHSSEYVLHCILTGYCAARLYVCAARNYRVKGLGLEAWGRFCEWTQKEIKHALRRVSDMTGKKREALLASTDMQFDTDFQTAVLELYALAGGRFVSEPAIANSLCAYLTHTLTEYFAYAGEVFHELRKEEILALTDKLIGYYSGDLLGRYAAMHEKDNSPVCELARRYARGV